MVIEIYATVNFSFTTTGIHKTVVKTTVGGWYCHTLGSSFVLYLVL